MYNILLEIEGRIVSNATLVHDYAQIAFGADFGLSIYNDFSISPDIFKIFDLDGRRLNTVSQQKESINLIFSEGLELKIDMRDCAFNGPEALQLNIRGEPTVIWS